MTATAYVSQISEKIGFRELNVLAGKLGISREETKLVEIEDSPGPGNSVHVAIQSEHVTEVVSGIGERGVSANRVANGVANEVKRYLKADVPVGEHLADQLIVPMSIGAGGRFCTLPPSQHLKTVIDVVREFVDVDIQLRPTDGIAWEVEVKTSLNDGSE